MSLSQTTRNWIDHPYEMDMEALRFMVIKEVTRVVDDFQDPHDIAEFLEAIERAEAKIYQGNLCYARTLERIQASIEAVYGAEAQDAAEKEQDRNGA